MLLWGVGALAMSFFPPRVLWVLGISFMVCGLVTFVLRPVPAAPVPDRQLVVCPQSAPISRYP